MFLETQPFYVEDFSGGFTDFYLDARPNRAALNDNLIIDKYQPLGKLKTRQGSDIWSTTRPQIPIGSFRIGNMLLFKDLVFNPGAPFYTPSPFNLLLIQSTNKIFYVDPPAINFAPDTWVTVKGQDYSFEATITGPSVAATFTKVTHDMPASPTDGKYTNTSHNFDAGQPVILTTTGTLPLPFVVGTTYYVLPVLPVPSQFVLSLTPAGPAIASTTAGTGIHTVHFAGMNDVYQSTHTTAANVSSFALWNSFVFTCNDDGFTHPQKIYAPGYQKKLVTQNVGLPTPGENGFAIPNRVFSGQDPFAPLVNTYLYAMHYESDFKIKDDSIEFLDRGTPYFGLTRGTTFFPFQAFVPAIEGTSINEVAYPGPTGGVNFTIIPQIVVHWIAHGLTVGDGVIFRIVYDPASGATPIASGVLPDGVVENKIYFVANFTPNTFEITMVPSLAPSAGMTSTSAGSGVVSAYQRHPVGIKSATFPFSRDGQNYHPNTKAVLSRTINNGQQFYVVARISPGETYYDGTSDDDLQNGELLYTEDGTVEYHEPYPSKFIHIINDTAYYGYCWETVFVPVEGYEKFVSPNKIFQSIPGVPGSINPSFFVLLDQEVHGISSYQGSPIALCEGSVYRIDGQFDELGRGGMTAQRISKEASCISHNGIVQTNDGIFWPGKNGIFFSDGYKCFRVTNGWPNTYANLVKTQQQRDRIQGRLDTINRRIYWTVQEFGQADNNKIYVLDLNYGISDDMPFTSLSGNTSLGVDHFSPTAIEIDTNNTWYRGDRRGYIFKHSDGALSDPKIDTGIDPTLWLKEAIIYRYITPAFNFGMSFTRYWVPRIIIQCRNVTNLALQLYSNNDDSREVSALKIIKFTGNVIWGDPDVIWGDPSIPWNLTGFIEQQRRFPARNLRCSFKQIEFTNAKVPQAKSDLLGIGTVDAVLKTVTIAHIYPPQLVNWFIRFSNDNYSREFPITLRNSDTVLTYSDPSNLGPTTGTWEWEILGVSYDEVFSLQSFTLHYAGLGKTQRQFHTGDLGGNANAPE